MNSINLQKSVGNVTMKKIHCIKCNKYINLKNLGHHMFLIKKLVPFYYL